jgi:adhesin transport system membrane fusion protein
MLAKVELKPGMTSTIDIKTKTRSVLRYLVKPVIRTFSGALNER